MNVDLERQLGLSVSKIIEQRQTIFGLETEIEDLEHQIEDHVCEEDPELIAAEMRLQELEDAIRDMHRGLIGLAELYDLMDLR